MSNKITNSRIVFLRVCLSNWRKKLDVLLKKGNQSNSKRKGDKAMRIRWINPEGTDGPFLEKYFRKILKNLFYVTKKKMCQKIRIKGFKRMNCMSKTRQYQTKTTTKIEELKSTRWDLQPPILARNSIDAHFGISKDHAILNVNWQVCYTNYPLSMLVSFSTLWSCLLRRKLRS